MSRTKVAPPSAKSASPTRQQLHELVWEALETELGGVEIYRTALQCVENEDLRDEWTRYLAQTEEHVRALQDVCADVGLDPDQDTPGRAVVRHIGRSLVQAMNMALGSDDPAAAEIVAAECVALAESKDHLNWSLIGQLLETDGEGLDSLAAAQERIENEEDAHLYHAQGWARELWLKSLGQDAALPPPEEVEDVHSMAEAATARQTREQEPT
ncbi:MAG TPA: hypothetical protein VFY71_14345 [Planctomycetota bacterium]|nr:hypothetical protein [Planctomycetota bacterium]